MSGRILCVYVLGDFVAHIPKRPIQGKLHALLQYLDGCSHGPDHTTADDALRQLKMGVAEELDVLVIVNQLLRDIVQLKKFLMAAIKFFQRQPGLLKLLEKSLA